MGRKRNLLIIGAGQYGCVVKEIAEATKRFKCIDFVDDFSQVAVGTTADLGLLFRKYAWACVAIGNTDMRMRVLQQLKEIGYIGTTLIHPSAYISASAHIGEGSIVEPHVIVQANARIGNACLISSGAVINHNAIIEDGCHIDCNATVGARCIVKEKTKVECGRIYQGDIGYV